MRTILFSGGVYCSYFPEGIKDKLPEHILKVMKPYELDILGLMQNGFIIQVIKDFTTGISDEDMQAMLLHEYGHVHYGHTLPENIAKKKTQNGIMDDVQSEIEADAYAASIIGKRRMAIALTHMVENVAKFFATKNNNQALDKDVYTEILTSMLISENTRKRFLALSE